MVNKLVVDPDSGPDGKEKKWDGPSFYFLFCLWPDGVNPGKKAAESLIHLWGESVV